jgi:hypothetical protein
MREFIALPFRLSALLIVFVMCVVALPLGALASFLNGVASGIEGK